MITWAVIYSKYVTIKLIFSCLLGKLQDTDESSSQIIDQLKIKDMNEEGEMIDVRIEKQEPIFSHMKPEVLLELQSMFANKKNEQVLWLHEPS